MTGLMNHLARKLGRKGRGGDTIVAHINPQEASLLRMLGGAGTRNPKTGLLEFKYGADTKEGGAKGTGGGAGTAGNGSSKGGSENAAAGSRAASERDATYGGGYGLGGGSPGLGGKFGNENAAIGVMTAKVQDPAVTAIRDIMSGYNSLDGLSSTVSNIGKWTGRVASLLGAPMGLGLVVGAPQLGAIMEQNNLEKMAAILGGAEPGSVVNTNAGPVAVQGGDLYGGLNSGTTNLSKLTHDIASGSFTGGDLGGYARDGAGGPGGNRPTDHTVAAQGAQQSNAGGGLVAALNPVPATVDPNLPPGLLPYLAQNLGPVPGYRMTSRFGTGAVAPLDYMRALA
jgi:hypothetical protein